MDWITELLVTYLPITPEIASGIAVTLVGLIYWLVTAAIHYFDNKYAGKQDNFILDYFILPLVKKVLVRIEPGKVGRRIVEKRHPESLNAKRSTEDDVFMRIH